MEFQLDQTQQLLMLPIFPKHSNKIQILRNLNFNCFESYWNQIFAIFAEDNEYPHWKKCSKSLQMWKQT